MSTGARLDALTEAAKLLLSLLKASVPAHKVNSAFSTRVRAIEDLLKPERA